MTLSIYLTIVLITKAVVLINLPVLSSLIDKMIQKNGWWTLYLLVLVPQYLLTTLCILLILHYQGIMPADKLTAVLGK